MITDAVVTEQWLRATGHRLAADERARTMRTARIRLDRLLGVGEHEPTDHPGFECPGMFGDGGKWQPCCGRSVA
jgi:hypothetical protein